MTAIDSSSEFIYHSYHNKEWSVERLSFPTAMSFEDVRKYLNINEMMLGPHDNDSISVYTSKEFYKESNSRTYAVELVLFEDHVQFIICPSFVDLIQLFNEIKGYVSLINS